MSYTGRPTIFTQEKADLIVKAIRRGLPYKLAVSAGGISYNTFIRWRNEGATPEGPKHLREFCHQVRMAEAEAAQRFVTLIESAAAKNWQAAAWMLERRHPDLFGKDIRSPDIAMVSRAFPIHDED